MENTPNNNDTPKPSVFGVKMPLMRNSLEVREANTVCSTVQDMCRYCMICLLLARENGWMDAGGVVVGLLAAHYGELESQYKWAIEEHKRVLMVSETMLKGLHRSVAARIIEQEMELKSLQARWAQVMGAEGDMS